MLIENLTLTQSPSVFENLEFRERLDRPKFNNLQKSEHLRSITTNVRWSKSVPTREKMRGSKRNSTNEKDQFAKFQRIMDEEAPKLTVGQDSENMTFSDSFTVKYKLSGNGYGRVTAVNSMTLGIVRGALRNVIAESFYYDIDMKNCHPTILYQLCVKHDISCPYLKVYVNNREKWLNRLIELHNIEGDDPRDIVKALVIKLINHRTDNNIAYSNWSKGDWNNDEQRRINPRPCKALDNDTLEFEKEMTVITKELKTANPEMYEAVTKYKDWLCPPPGT